MSLLLNTNFLHSNIANENTKASCTLGANCEAKRSEKERTGANGTSRSERIQAILQGEININRVEFDAAMAYLKQKWLLLSENIFLKNSFLSKKDGYGFMKLMKHDQNMGNTIS